MARTDPTMYQWERLSPEQQQAVLATIKAAGIRRGSAGIFDRRVLIVLLAAVMLVLMLLLVH
jgi:hypothetical protein